jgi:ribonuclease E
MTTRMLIDARHREETRVAVVTGNKIEEFDFESAEHKQLKGNIYLAKVTRVEPSLQAAFVDYGGNRHGFLAFAEIHPDYYQIPKEDRERLLAEEAAAAAEEAALREQEEEEDNEPAELMRSEAVDDEDSDLIEVEDDDHVDTIDVTEGEGPDMNDSDGDDQPENDGQNGEGSSQEDSDNKGRGRGRNRRGRGRGGKAGGNNGDGNGNGNGNGRDNRGKAKASDEARTKRMNIRRRYKIQDVIHRRQVLLVQVVKEERGNKGAALTTYLSLAGRYCVLMPNTSHGGGISRKINSAADRKRLKSIMSDMTLPATMGCIIRTAGLARTKTEIKRDFDYLARLWDGIRENTLRASAPELIHSDSDLIKRAIRDIYNREISEVIVEGEDGHRAARDFMKLLMPSHARRIHQYADPVPLFQRYGAEDQLNAMYNPIVQLKSGGYIVINPTEALVSIDINSGRSTKEHGIEQTALSTNLEAAREIARQLRLRDMAGLVVIDFIDMEQHSNNRKVERAMKDALKNDRARIQVGRISSFGLMEMSRQRLRTGVLEASTRQCPHCEGTGLVRTESSSALSALRLIEDEAARGNGSVIQLQASQEATIYVLNNKRVELAEIEARYHVSISITPNGEVEGAKMTVTCSGPKPDRPNIPLPIVDYSDDDIEDDIEDEIEDEEDSEVQAQPKTRSESETREAADGSEQDGKRKRRRGRRGGRNRDRKNRVDGENGEMAVSNEADQSEASSEIVSQTDASEISEKPKSRRSRRGVKGREVENTQTEASEVIAEVTAEAAQAEDKPKTRRRPASKAAAEKAKTAAINVEAPAVEEAPAKPKRASRAKAKPSAAETSVEITAEQAPTPPKARASRKKAEPKATEPKSEAAANIEASPDPKKRPSRAKKAGATKKNDSDAAAQTAPAESDQAQPTRSGWWQRTFG